MPPDPLEPVREALLRDARDEAATLLARADEAAAAALAEAWRESELIRDRARAAGAADADVVVAAQRSRAGREARAVVLAAQRAEYDALRVAAREAVAALVTEPSYPALRARLAELLRGLLGDTARIADAPGGGVTATVPGRSADLTLARLADRAVDAVLAEEPSWPADVRLPAEAASRTADVRLSAEAASGTADVRSGKEAEP